jgi:Domain of unknown function (DUF4389)
MPCPIGSRPSAARFAISSTLISLFTVLFTERIPQPLFAFIVMTYRYEWRALSYAFFPHEDYPPFDFTPSSEDDGIEPHTTLRLTYPEHLDRWKPLYKWFLAIAQYFVVAGLAVLSCLCIVAGFFAVLVSGVVRSALRTGSIRRTGAPRSGRRLAPTRSA